MRLKDRMMNLKSQEVDFKSRAIINAEITQRSIASVRKSKGNLTIRTNLAKAASVRRLLCLANDHEKT